MKLSNGVRYWSEVLLLSYARVLFSGNRVAGALFLLATFVYPVHGCMGLAGVVFGNLTALILGMDRLAVRQGVFGLNALLVGLGLGFFYEPTASSLLLLGTSMVFLTLITTTLNHLWQAYLHLPAMSMPFTLMTWIVMLAAYGLGNLEPAKLRWSWLPLPDPQLLPGNLSFLLSGAGALFFQFHPLAGAIILGGLALSSRIALALICAGLISSSLFFEFLGADPSWLETRLLGFNPMLTALAMGGIFSVPSPGSALLGVLCALLAAMLSIALAPILGSIPPGLSPLALPFNLVVLLGVISLRLRSRATLGIHLFTGASGTPEQNLKAHRDYLRFLENSRILVSLPIHGKWKVSQGIDGPYTHQGAWRFAYDFQAVDSQGRIFKNTGLALDDYFAFGRPVLAPAHGRVCNVYDGVPDNAIGLLNVEQNWGNTVILEHAPGFYSCLAHLKLGSAKVRPGQEIRKGQVLGECGNSGRSAYPHLHLQFQSTPAVGAPSLAFELSNIVVVNTKGGPEFRPRGHLSEGDIVQNLVPALNWESYFPFAFGREWRFRKGQIEEVWKAGVDFNGCTFLESTPRRTVLRFGMKGGVLFRIDLEGNQKTLLFRLGRLLTELPFTESPGGQPIRWNRVEPAENTLFADLLALVDLRLQTEKRNELSKEGDEFHLRVDSTLVLRTPLGRLRLRELPRSSVTFASGVGVQGIT